MLKKMRFNLDENLQPTEKGPLMMLMTSMGRQDMVSKIAAGELTRNEVKDLIDPLKKLIANAERDPASVSPLIASVARSILGKFESFLK